VTAYLDHAATTPLRPEALEAMLPLLSTDFGNPSSTHAPGRRARASLDEARARFAAAIGAQPREIVFTASGTEASNLAIKGAAWAAKTRGHRILCTAVEHHATLNTVRYLAKFGFEVVELPVDRYGRLDPEHLAAALHDRTILVSIILANNEVGTIQPIADLIARMREHRGLFVHLDAIQAAPYLDIDVERLDADMISFSAHKFEGPKGTGALWIRHGTALLPQTQGGNQERYRRAGTEDVAGAVGMAVAFELNRRERLDTTKRLRRFRDRLKESLLAVPGVELTGHPRERLPGHLSVIVRDAEGESIALALDLEGIACSTGAACTSGSREVSHVLSAMGYPDEEARGALRLTVGRTTTEAELDEARTVIPGVVERLRAALGAMAVDPLGEGLRA
jgi:cysteine desulfurase